MTGVKKKKGREAKPTDSLLPLPNLHTANFQSPAYAKPDQEVNREMKAVGAGECCTSATAAGMAGI